ncbi:MAG: DUF192 domain-containing protein [Candidatus Pacebacteria bacterium]|jgi:hypothetical protein|nr:DUF192 domain-containing protein [Candidatus Paceibacterota bacterium]
MKRSSRLIIGGLVLVGGAVLWWLFFTPTPPIPLAEPETTRADYEPLIPLTLGGRAMYASVADESTERQLGLSRTTTLPSDVVKLFVFPTADFWSFWMKEMLYSIDIVWLDTNGTIVHIEHAVSPDTYPTSFVPAGRAQFVIETNAGFVDEQNLNVGDVVLLPPLQAID